MECLSHWFDLVILSIYLSIDDYQAAKMEHSAMNSNSTTKLEEGKTSPSIAAESTTTTTDLELDSNERSGGSGANIVKRIKNNGLYHYLLELDHLAVDHDLTATSETENDRDTGREESSPSPTSDSPVQGEWNQVELELASPEKSEAEEDNDHIHSQ